jgi:molybdopterin molybdotransferase
MSVDELTARIDARVHRLEDETIELAEAWNRVLSLDIVANAAVPGFDRAAMDGYAVRGEETFGATSYTPAFFRVVGSARPGRRFESAVGPGEAVEITTGSPLPDGADSVVKVEATQRRASSVEISEPTPPGRHVSRRGEDIQPGTVALKAGRVLRPQDLGIVSALGHQEVRVVRKPRVAVVVTGDELLPPGTPPRNCQIPDTNSVMLAALVTRDGGVPIVTGPIGDVRDLVRDAIAASVRRADVVFVSGGSSTGPEDHAPGVVAEMGALLAHGVALRPASPSGLGFIGDVPVMLLPGTPVSCLCAYDFFAGRIVRLLGGRPSRWPYSGTVHPLAGKLASVVGRVEYCRVRVDAGRAVPIAVSGAGVLSSTTRTDGFIVVPADLEGYPEGTSVTVWRYDG